MRNNKAEALIVLVILVSFFHVYFSCTPSQKFLLKQNTASGIDKQFVRVLLKKTDKKISILSNYKIRMVDSKTGTVIYYGPGKEIFFQPDQIVNPVFIESWSNPLAIDGEGYRGNIELHNVLGKIHVINVVQMNEYLYSVVAGEIVSSWKMEALKAQAVAARTYTYYHLNKKKTLYDLDNTNNFQVYKGVSVEKESTCQAVDETSGKIAFYNDKPILAFFHSTCGGRTMYDKYVWDGEGQEYLKSTTCTFCKESPYFNWEEKVTLYEIKEFLGKKYKGVGGITGVVFQKKENRVISAVIHHKNGIVKLTGNELRLLFPEKKIKSMFFTAEKTKDGLILHGHGWGHGVGMCQWGAKGMAEQGANYKDILQYYYKGIRISGAGQKDYAGR